MNKSRLVFFLLLSLLCVDKIFPAQGTSADTVLTNNGLMNYTKSGVVFQELAIETSLTVGTVFGLSPLSAPALAYGQPTRELRMNIYVTNNGNEADNDAGVMITSFSNSAGYTGTAWSYYLEVGGVNQGTNYAIPFTQFGEGAVFQCVLVLNVPLCETNVRGYFTVEATTVSNTGHRTAIYTGWNGTEYGGVDRVSADIEVRLLPLNSLARLYATDEIDYVTVFDGSTGLRRSRNTIHVEFSDPVLNAGTMRLWFALDGPADGPGGSTADSSLTVTALSSRSFEAYLSEADLALANYVSFVWEADGIVYGTPYLYRLLNLNPQENYRTIIMNNVIGDSPGYVRLPADTVGQDGRIEVYSIAGDRIRQILEGTAQEQVYGWDGNDQQGERVRKGVYFLIIDFPGLKEIRKFYVR